MALFGGLLLMRPRCNHTVTDLRCRSCLESKLAATQRERDEALLGNRVILSDLMEERQKLSESQATCAMLMDALMETQCWCGENARFDWPKCKRCVVLAKFATNEEVKT